jgi:hypothetical protein
MGPVEDRMDIQELLVRYGYLLDTFQFERIAPEIFTEDAVLNYGTGDVVGREAIDAFFGQFRAALDGISHNITNFIVDVEGDTARALSRNTGWHWHAFMEPAGALSARAWPWAAPRSSCGPWPRGWSGASSAGSRDGPVARELEHLAPGVAVTQVSEPEEDAVHD